MKILMIGSSPSLNSGVARYTQNLLLNMDLKKYQVDMLVSPPGKNTASAQKQFEDAGVKLFWLPDSDKRRLFFYPGYLKKHHDYDIIHLHTASKVNALACVVLRLFCPKAKLIVHSHIVYPPLTWDWHLAHLVYQLTAHYFLGCGVEAGRFVFGHRIDKKKNFSVACNAVDKTRFYPDPARRAEIRQQLGLDDSHRAVGFVGRYNHQKNLTWLLDCFAELYRLAPDCRLVMVGGGEDQPMVDEKIRRLGLTDGVIQTGVQNDIPAYMNAFDAFLLPSEFEGSPVTLIEAQGCGCPCYASTNVPQDGKLTPIIQYLPLELGARAWAEKINAEVTVCPHQDYWKLMEEAGYELKAAAKRMERLYDELVK